jgi:IS4 transposase
VTLAALFDRFLNDAPLAVMVRGLLQRALKADDLDHLFEHVTRKQYTRELLFSSVVEMLARVALRVHRSLRQAYLDHPANDVSLSALYQKVNGLETDLGPAVVRHSAARLGDVIAALGPLSPPWRAGYRVKILDGNHLAGTHKRLGVLRDSRAAALPGELLVVLDPQRRLFADLIACPDAYTQERALLAEVLPQVQPKDVWIADRNFCTPRFLVGLDQGGACFAIREHAQLNIRSEGPLRRVGRTATGEVFEQAAVVSDDKAEGLTGAQEVRVRRVLIRLDQPTRDGDVEVSVLSNLPEDTADALAVAELYLERWTIEVAFAELTVVLRCEIETLGYPQAALFCFAVAALVANVLAVVRQALQAEHGAERAQELSIAQTALDVSGLYRGMMVALPAEEWRDAETMPLQEFAAWLRRAARAVDWNKGLTKSRRGPKKPPTDKPSAARNRHVSTHRLLQEHKKRPGL